MGRLRVGKLSHERLAGLLARLPVGSRSAVPVGPMVGEDAGAIRLPGGRVLVTATDPVTFAAERIGWYAVQINANDVAACGAKPGWFSACVLLPERGPQPVDAIFGDVAGACEALGVSVVSGHTEVTAGLDRPIVVGQMMGLTLGRDPVRSGGAKVGDAIVMTKSAGIEATAIIAMEKGPRLTRRVGARTVSRGVRFLMDPGISVVDEALVATRAGVSAMHDPTEGGVLCGLWEMGEASGRRFEVDVSAMPVMPETRRLCEAVGMDPLRSLGSGCLLMTVSEARLDGLLRRLTRAGVAATRIGRVCRGDAGLVDGRGEPIAVSAVDEITKL